MAAWLDLVNEDGAWTLVDTGRLEELVQGMPCPKRQCPCLVYFAGGLNRLKALRALNPHNNVTHIAAQKCADFETFAETGETVILDLRRRHGLSDTVAFEPLRTLILGQLSAIRTEQDSTDRRFSVSHLGAF
ncbi:hypothetical protein N7490_006768 [Penicillium lividum]|nr:hypothetical protein N7490_006768 [Penicillium lividum]